MPKEKRTCYACSYCRVCIVFHTTVKATNYVRVNIDGDGAPGRWVEVFDALGRCCLEYKPLK